MLQFSCPLMTFNNINMNDSNTSLDLSNKNIIFKEKIFLNEYFYWKNQN